MLREILEAQINSVVAIPNTPAAKLMMGWDQVR